MTYTFPKDFSEPVLALTILGEKSARLATWLDYAAYGITSAHIPELLHILQKVEDFWPDETTEDEPELYAPIHAWRALAQLKAEPAIPKAAPPA